METWLEFAQESNFEMRATISLVYLDSINQDCRQDRNDLGQISFDNPRSNMDWLKPLYE